MWDGGVNNLEVQPISPITNPVEMNENFLGNADARQLAEEQKIMFPCLNLLFGDKVLSASQNVLLRALISIYRNDDFLQFAL